VLQAYQRKPDIIMTVDNGISSVDGVNLAKELGIKVLITDHHLAPTVLPLADVIVNPNQANDKFPSKNLAGVGVCFYVLLALRALLREECWFVKQNIAEPKLADYLDIVALGTVADVVILDQNNRTLVHQGILRIRQKKCIVGIQALIEIAGRDIEMIGAADLGFSVAPRLNAAGRLDDMSLGIECLLTDDLSTAQDYAKQLDVLNRERRNIESEMKTQAIASLKKLELDERMLPLGLVLFDPTWHQGVIGIIASRIKDKYHRPVIAFAPTETNELKGSARSISGIHIRDVLDSIATQHPTLITKFGGHAMAAGLSLLPDRLIEFQKVFYHELEKHLTHEALQGEILSDGELDEGDISIKTTEMLIDAGPWGQGFPEPIFDGVFEILDQRIVGQQHLRLSLRAINGQRIYSAVKFYIDLDEWPNYHCNKARIAYKLEINVFNNLKNVQLNIVYIEIAHE
jgi:single-stranded-DNA-specific exonuclease